MFRNRSIGLCVPFDISIGRWQSQTFSRTRHNVSAERFPRTHNYYYYFCKSSMLTDNLKNLLLTFFHTPKAIYFYQTLNCIKTLNYFLDVTRHRIKRRIFKYIFERHKYPKLIYGQLKRSQWKHINFFQSCKISWKKSKQCSIRFTKIAKREIIYFKILFLTSTYLG